MKRTLSFIVLASVLSIPANKGCEKILPRQPVKCYVETGQRKKYSQNYITIKKNLEDLALDYLKTMKNKQHSIREVIEKYGFETAYNIRFKTSLNMLNYAYESKKIDKERCEKIAIDYLSDLGKYSNAPVNYLDRKVIEGYAEWVEFRTKLFKKMLNAKQSSDYRKLFKSVFSEKDAKEIIRKQTEIINKIYDALIDAREGIIGLFAKGPINKARKDMIEFYKKRIEEIYENGKRQTEEK